MADSICGILTCMSKNCLIQDVEQFVDALNSYEHWSIDGGSKGWKLASDTYEGLPHIYYDCSPWGVLYPNVGVYPPTSILKEPTNIWADEVCDGPEYSGEQYRDDTDRYMSHNLGKHIARGWFEIACSSHEKMNQVEMSRLRIYAGGLVKLTHQYSRSIHGSEYRVRTFDPVTKQVTVVINDGTELFQ
jgi:hypothetical protein